MTQRGDRRKWLRYEVSRRTARGDSQRQMAKALEIDRKTVRRIQRELAEQRERPEQAPPLDLLPRRAARPSKLDPYNDQIKAWLEEYPDLKTTRLHEMLVAKGFDGGYTIVRERRNQLQPKPKREPAVHVVTPPGQQAQADWSPYKIAHGRIDIHAFSIVLCFSRYQYLGLSMDERQVTVLRHLVRAFDEFQGVPPDIVFDTMPGVVDGWEFGKPILNLSALDFAAHYGFAIHPAPRGQARYKGKVERPFRYLEDSFLNGRTFNSIEQARATLRWWLDEKANVRIHRTLRERPIDRLERDRAALLPLPTHSYDTRELCYRLVDGYGDVLFDGNSYSVPHEWVGHIVYLRASEQVVEVFDCMAHRLAEHEREKRNAGKLQEDPRHRKRKRPISWDVLMSRFASWGEDIERWAHAVRRRQRYGRVQLLRVLDMQLQYSAEDVVAAIQHVARHQAFDAKSVARVLNVRAEPRTLEQRLTDKARARIKETMRETPVVQRSIDAYGQLLAHSTRGQENDDNQ